MSSVIDAKVEYLAHCAIVASYRYLANADRDISALNGRIPQITNH